MDEVFVSLYGGYATKLLRLQLDMIQALDRHRRGNQQTVEVRHVHIYPGAQAGERRGCKMSCEADTHTSEPLPLREAPRRGAKTRSGKRCRSPQLAANSGAGCMAVPEARAALAAIGTAATQKSTRQRFINKSCFREDFARGEGGHSQATHTDQLCNARHGNGRRRLVPTGGPFAIHPCRIMAALHQSVQRVPTYVSSLRRK